MQSSLKFLVPVLVLAARWPADGGSAHYPDVGTPLSQTEIQASTA
jgi:hypothetical protein